jgi:prophage regulatory protein
MTYQNSPKAKKYQDRTPNENTDPVSSIDNAHRLLSLKQVEFLTSLKKSTLYALIGADEFPGQVYVTTRRRAWLASEVQEWIASRLRARNYIGSPVSFGGVV